MIIFCPNLSWPPKSLSPSRHVNILDYLAQDKTQSSWPEYAVKIIQASKIAAMSYRTSVIREMAVLQLLSHPGVARLVSAFRYSDSAYMVLEYAARGDLHSYLIKHGSLEHKYTR